MKRPGASANPPATAAQAMVPIMKPDFPAEVEAQFAGLVDGMVAKGRQL
ncbi:MAG: hypothetical protein OXC01_08120 [Immundisolibacterales bacterium]|nr:hypothetical protein [Immundisolibacterales bacterium]